EWHGGYSVSYVRKGTFGYRVRGRSFDLVAGSTLVGRAGDEYLCTHDHVCGDECLAFRLPLEMIDSMTGERLWQSRGFPPIAELVVLGELGQAAYEGRSDVGVDEVGVTYAARFLEIVAGKTRPRGPLTIRDRRRAVDAALWLDENAHRPIDLATAADQAG